MLNTKPINEWLASMHVDLGSFEGSELDLELTEMVYAQSKEFLSANPDEEYEKAVMMEYINEYEYRKNREYRNSRNVEKFSSKLRKEVKDDRS